MTQLRSSQKDIFQEMIVQLQVFAYEGDRFHGRYVNWQSNLASPFEKFHYSNDKPEFENDEEIEQAWMELFQKQFTRQLIVEVEPDTLVQNLVEDLAQNFREISEPSMDEVIGIDIATGEKFRSAIAGPRGEFNRCHLVHIPLGHRFNPELTLKEVGIEDGDILGLISVYPAGYQPHLFALPSSADLFALIHSENEKPPQYRHLHEAMNANPYGHWGSMFVDDKPVHRTWGALLYTDEDKDLALYVRRHFASLNKMSGKALHIFVIEKPADDDWRSVFNYWKGFVQEKFFIIWNTMGWLSSKPYDKSQAYEVGFRLGIFPDQLPCLVLFDDIQRKEKLVFPIYSATPDFFRNLFSMLEQVFQSEEFLVKQMVDDSFNAYEAIKDRYDAIITKLKQKNPDPSSPDRTQYTFHGQTVFINRPQGTVNLSDYQNKS